METKSCKRSVFKKTVCVLLSILMIASIAVMDISANAAEADGYLTISVVNFDSTWGDVDANVEKMVSYIEQAKEENVEFLLFPEMCVNGYCYSNSLDSKQSKFAVESAETVDGATATQIAALADEYDMWIAYGATEVVPGDDEHAYNSIFACSPEGEVVSYQKIHPVEGVWCEAGTTPVILETDECKVGISICYDTYAVPELERYYDAMGCQVVLNPTATSRGSYTDEDGSLNTENWQWYYEDRLESIVDRDGIYIASADLAGKEYDEDGELLYNFPGGSVVIGPGGSSDTGKYTEYYAGDPSEQTPGLYTATIDVSLAKGGDVNSSLFQSNLYTEWYADLADEDTAAQATVTDPVIATVNFNAVWGDLDANLEQMIGYIIDAAKSDTDIIVFPEMALQGYCSSSNSESETYRLAVDKAITTKGYYAKTLSEYAEKYDMYIIFGASEKIPASENPDELDQAYNSAFCCSPDGTVTSYQKIQPVEGSWCMSGTTPVIIETEFGSMGLSICKDTYSYPELERYYAAKGCTYIVNPTATSRGGASRWSWYYSRRLESIVDRDKMVVISADLCGTQYDSEGNAHSTFPGGSCVMAPLRSAVNSSYVDYVAGSSEYDPINVGLCIGTLNTASSKYSIGFSITGFNPSLYSAMYGVLAGTVDVAEITATPAAIADDSEVTIDESVLAKDGYTFTYNTYDIKTGLTTPFASKSIYKELESVTASFEAEGSEVAVYSVFDGILTEVSSTYSDGTVSFETSGGTYAVVAYTEDTSVTTESTESESTDVPSESTEATTESTEATTESTEATTESTEATTESTEATTESTEATTESTEPATEVTDPTYSPSVTVKKTSLKAGKTTKASIKNIGDEDAVVTYSSSNSKIAKINKTTGKVTALKKGTTTITATVTYNRYSVELEQKVKVTSNPKLKKSSITVAKGSTKTVKIVGKASNVKNVYKNTKIAKITSKKNATKLKVKGLKVGKTTLKVKVNGKLLKLKVKVK